MLNKWIYRGVWGEIRKGGERSVVDLRGRK